MNGAACQKITIVVVGKRHHIRFYPTAEGLADTFHKDKGKVLFNSIPGTVVDRGITAPKEWDFYLQSHAAIKGTVSTMSQITWDSTGKKSRQNPRTTW